MGGIYAIVHKPSQKRYIGSTIDFKSRKTQHFTDLRCGRHFNQYLQNAFSKYGEEQFMFEIIQDGVAEARLLDLERSKILEFDSVNHTKGYNLTAETKAPMRGRKMSEADKQKKSEFFTGSKHPRSKICESAIPQIFKHYAQGMTQKQIAERIGISQSNVSLILRGKAWDHVGLSLNVVRCDNKSGCIGVYYDKALSKWKAEIIRKGKYFGLGYFVSKEDAISARKEAEVSFGF